MAFVKTNWVNDAEPDITAEELNRIELGIEEAHTLAGSASLAAANAASAAQTATNGLSAHTQSTGNPHNVTSKQVGGRHIINAVKRGARGDDATDNTALLQAMLDEIRDSARPRELYLPGDEGTVYRTKGLWVPSRVRIVSDGAELKITGKGAQRSTSDDADPIFATAGLTIRAQKSLGFTSIVTDVAVEGLTVNVSVATDGADDLYGVQVAGQRVRLEHVRVTGVPHDALVIDNRSAFGTPEEILARRCLFENGRRNSVSLIVCRYVWLEDNLIRNCAASSPEFDPGAGIDIEPNVAGDPLHDIFIRNNVIRDNAGSGIALILEGWAGDDSTNADGIVIEGNAIRGNGIKAGGDATTTGGIEARAGTSSLGLRIVNNTIRSQVAGPAVYLNGFNPVVVIAHNDLRTNPGGGISGAAAAGSYTTGNLN